MRSTVLALAVLIWNAPAHAAVVVDAAFVRQAIERGALIWDVRAKPDYRKGHIPGAVSIGEAASELRDPNSEDFIAQSDIEEILGSAGIDPAKEVIVYGWRGSTTPHLPGTPCGISARSEFMCSTTGSRAGAKPAVLPVPRKSGAPPSGSRSSRQPTRR